MASTQINQIFSPLVIDWTLPRTILHKHMRLFDIWRAINSTSHPTAKLEKVQAVGTSEQPDCHLHSYFSNVCKSYITQQTMTAISYDNIVFIKRCSNEGDLHNYIKSKSI